MDVSLTDEELLYRFRSAPESSQREEWIDELFRRHYQKVAVWCLRITAQRDAAADLAQEIFVKAYQSLDSFRGQSKFSTWLYTITRNHCYNYFKSISRRPNSADEDELLEIEDPFSNEIFERITARDSQQKMLELIYETLDATEVKVMTLHYAEEMPLKAVTGLLGLDNPSGAKAYIVRAKRKLATAVNRWQATEARLNKSPEAISRNGGRGRKE